MSHLKHLVRRGLDSGHQVVRGVGHLLHIGKVVHRIPIEHHLAHLDQWVILVRPHLHKKTGVRSDGALCLQKVTNKNKQTNKTVAIRYSSFHNITTGTYHEFYTTYFI